MSLLKLASLDCVKPNFSCYQSLIYRHFLTNSRLSVCVVCRLFLSPDVSLCCLPFIPFSSCTTVRRFITVMFCVSGIFSFIDLFYCQSFMILPGAQSAVHSFIQLSTIGTFIVFSRSQSGIYFFIRLSYSQFCLSCRRRFILPARWLIPHFSKMD